MHSKRWLAPAGRNIGSLAIRDVIWHARNQSMHYEEGLPTQPETRQAFEVLEREHGQAYALSNALRHSRAQHVLFLLGWDTYAAYLADMQTLLP